MKIGFANNGMEKAKLLKRMVARDPLLQKELFIYMDQESAHDYYERLVMQLKEQGLLEQRGRKLMAPQRDTEQFHSAWLLSRAMQETVQRYAVVLRVLEISQTISRGQLEKTSRKIAERLSSLYGMSSPEFYDKNVFSCLVTALREQELVISTEDGTLKHSDNSRALQADINQLVWPEISQHLLQLESV